MGGALTTTLDVVSDVVRSIPSYEGQAPLSVTRRLKNVPTLIDKLRAGKDLSSIQDVVGVRIVDPSGGRHEQDEIVTRLRVRFADVRVKDRRREPSHGYRAVHVIPKIDRRPVEIQVRTGLQHAWANAMEECGDRWGRGIRYGEPPLGGPEEVADRAKQLADLMRVAEAIARWELEEVAYCELRGRRYADAARARPGISLADQRKLYEQHQPADFAEARRALDDLVSMSLTDQPLMAEFRVQFERWTLPTHGK